MRESYCGKLCSACVEKQAGRCASCLSGPGRPVVGVCEIASCAREKGNESCDTCTYRAQHGCGKFSRKDDRLKQITEQMEKDTYAYAALLTRAAVLAKWLKPLFWMIVPNVIVSVLPLEAMGNLIPALQGTGQYLSALVTLVYGIILLCIRSCSRGYFFAGICSVAAALINVVITVTGGGPGALIFVLPSVVAVLYGEYWEFTTHGKMLVGANDDLAGKWSLLWKWRIGITIAAYASVFLSLAAPIFGMLAVLVLGIGMIVVGVLKLVYLYRTMKTFTALAAEERLQV